MSKTQHKTEMSAQTKTAPKKTATKRKAPAAKALPKKRSKIAKIEINSDLDYIIEIMNRGDPEVEKSKWKVYKSTRENPELGTIQRLIKARMHDHIRQPEVVVQTVKNMQARNGKTLS